MYVRLKHTLSTLTLEMLDQRPDQRAIAWLLAYARLSKAGKEVPFDLLRTEAAGLGPSNLGALEALEKLGLMNRTGSSVGLAPGYKPYFAYFARQVERLGVALRSLDGQEGLEVKDRPLGVAIALFNSGLFFECHEYLEGLWRQTYDEPRDFYHGIIQLAAAFYHYEKGNLHGARTLLAKARRRLEGYAPRYRALDVGRLLVEMESWEGIFSPNGKTAFKIRREKRLPILPVSSG